MNEITKDKIIKCEVRILSVPEVKICDGRMQYVNRGYCNVCIPSKRVNE